LYCLFPGLTTTLVVLVAGVAAGSDILLILIHGVFLVIWLI
jgi:hypothetical protein